MEKIQGGFNPKAVKNERDLSTFYKDVFHDDILRLHPIMMRKSYMEMRKVQFNLASWQSNGCLKSAALIKEMRFRANQCLMAEEFGMYLAVLQDCKRIQKDLEVHLKLPAALSIAAFDIYQKQIRKKHKEYPPKLKLEEIDGRGKNVVMGVIYSDIIRDE